MKKTYCARLTALVAEQVFGLIPSIKSHNSVAYIYLRMESQDLDNACLHRAFQVDWDRLGTGNSTHNAHPDGSL